MLKLPVCYPGKSADMSSVYGEFYVGAFGNDGVYEHPPVRKH